MQRRALALVTVLGFGVAAVLSSALPSPGGAQQAASGYTVPRTAWGDPDLTGKWPSTDMVGVPMQRDERFGTRNVLTDEEFADRQQRAAQQTEQDNADFELENAEHARRRRRRRRVASSALARARPAATPGFADRRSAERPHAAFTPQAQERQAALRTRRGRGPADSYTDRSNYDRCITRGLAGLDPAGHLQQRQRRSSRHPATWRSSTR